MQPIAGSVTVEAATGTPGAEPAYLAPGQAIVVPAAGARMQATTASATLWPSGMLEFDNTPLGRVIVEANRYSQAQIRLAEPALARLRVTGAYRAGDLEGLARSLEAAFGLKLERTGAGDFILQAGASPRGATEP